MMNFKELKKLYMTTDDGKMVMVEHVSEALVKSYGHHSWKDWDAASRGESKGIWRMVRRDREGNPIFSDQNPDPLVSGGKTARASFGTVDLFGDPAHLPGGGVGRPSRIPFRVGWVQDAVVVGGAELSAKTVIDVGTDLGWRVVVVTGATPAGGILALLRECDVVVLNNLWSFSREQMRAILEAVYSERVPYVKYEHDHRELDRDEFSRKLFQGSRLNVFLSPVHLENHRKALHCEGVALPLAIDVDRFVPVDGVGRRAGTALVCNTRNFKTWTNLAGFVRANPETEFTLLTDREPVVSGDNVRVRPKVPPDQMPSVYSEFERVVHLLDGWGAGERVVLEGALCGCEVVANEGVGHMSWGWDLSDLDGLRSELRKAPYEFWRMVGEAVA